MRIHLNDLRGYSDYLFESAVDDLVRDLGAGVLSITPGLSPREVGWVQYSAMHDTRTCNVCRELDGIILDVGGDAYRSGRYDPPRHPNCRCGWIRISRDETGVVPTEEESLPLSDDYFLRLQLTNYF